ncbi:MAG TPA: hypothetical protein VG013_17220, partial [Gemmataceae bacterium]|nr:hypothetical protein [Gemmataceae bacterium]
LATMPQATRQAGFCRRHCRTPVTTGRRIFSCLREILIRHLLCNLLLLLKPAQLLIDPNSYF